MNWLQQPEGLGTRPCGRLAAGPCSPMDGFVQLFIIIGVVVIGGDAPIFLVASEVLSVLLLLGLPFRLFNPKRGVSVKQDCGAWGSGRASPSWCE